MERERAILALCLQCDYVKGALLEPLNKEALDKLTKGIIPPMKTPKEFGKYVREKGGGKEMLQYMDSTEGQLQDLIIDECKIAQGDSECADSIMILLRNMTQLCCSNIPIHINACMQALKDKPPAEEPIVKRFRSVSAPTISHNKNTTEVVDPLPYRSRSIAFGSSTLIGRLSRRLSSSSKIHSASQEDVKDSPKETKVFRRFSMRASSASSLLARGLHRQAMQKERSSSSSSDENAPYAPRTRLSLDVQSAAKLCSKGPTVFTPITEVSTPIPTPGSANPLFQRGSHPFPEQKQSPELEHMGAYYIHPGSDSDDVLTDGQKSTSSTPPTSLLSDLQLDEAVKKEKGRDT